MDCIRKVDLLWKLVELKVAQLLRSKWLYARSEKIESYWTKNLGQIFVLPVFQFFLIKWLIFSLGARIEKIESFWLKDLDQILVPPVIHFFRSKWLIFSLGARSEKIESFWLKNLGQMLVPPVIQFFRSKWLISSLGAWSEKIRVILTQKFESNIRSSNLVQNFSQI